MLLDEIKETIKKNLPAQVSEELQTYLREANADKQENETLKKQIENLAKELSNIKTDNARIAQLDDDRKKLYSDRQAFEIEKREFQIRTLNEKYNDVKSLMHDVFRNQRMVYKKTGQTNYTDYGPGGSQSGNEGICATTEVIEE